MNKELQQTLENSSSQLLQDLGSMLNEYAIKMLKGDCTEEYSEKLLRHILEHVSGDLDDVQNSLSDAERNIVIFADILAEHVKYMTLTVIATRETENVPRITAEQLADKVLEQVTCPEEELEEARKYLSTSIVNVMKAITMDLDGPKPDYSNN